MLESPAALWTIRHRPYPQERPQYMQREQADPSRRMDRVLMGMIALFGDQIGNVVDRDDAVEHHHHHEEQQPEGKVVQEWIAHLPDSSSNHTTDAMRVKSLTKIKVVDDANRDSIGMTPIVATEKQRCSIGS